MVHVGSFIPKFPPNECERTTLKAHNDRTNAAAVRARAVCRFVSRLASDLEYELCLLKRVPPAPRTTERLAACKARFNEHRAHSSQTPQYSGTHSPLWRKYTGGSTAASTNGPATPPRPLSLLRVAFNPSHSAHRVAGAGLLGSIRAAAPPGI